MTYGFDGMLLYVGGATPGGFQVIEIRESEERCDRFNAEVVEPAIARLMGGSAPQPELEEFEPRGLVCRPRPRLTGRAAVSG
jgi:hypothetical protein